MSEYEGLESAHKAACFIEEHEEPGAELLAHFSSIEEARTAKDENYAGRYKSVADFAEELTEDSVHMPESLAHYIDYNAMAYDMEVGGDIFTIELGHREVHIFWSR